MEMLKFVRKCPIDNIPALIQITAWHRICDKPLFEPMRLWCWRTYVPLGLNELISAPPLYKRLEGRGDYDNPYTFDSNVMAIGCYGHYIDISQHAIYLVRVKIVQ